MFKWGSNREISWYANTEYKNEMSYYTENNSIDLLINTEENFKRIFNDIKNITIRLEVSSLIMKWML